MADPGKRQERWAHKTTPERTSEIVDLRRDTMKVNFTGQTNELLQMEQQVRQTLNAAGVPTIQYPFYLCFGRELHKRIRNGMAGESLAVECALLAAKWIAQGLTQSVLYAIRSEVFSIPAPLAP
jgi:hypothetical protein